MTIATTMTIWHSFSELVSLNTLHRATPMRNLKHLNRDIYYRRRRTSTFLSVGPGWLNELGRCRARVAQWDRSLDLTAHTSLSPIRRRFAPSFVNYINGCTRLAAASDKVYQLLPQGRWFSPGTPASSTTKTGRHDIAKILLKVALNTKNSNSNYISSIRHAQKCDSVKPVNNHKTFPPSVTKEPSLLQWPKNLPSFSDERTFPPSVIKEPSLL